MARNFSWLLPALLAGSTSLAVAAEPPQPMGRIDFQSEVSRTLPNDLLTASLSTELSEKDAGKLSRALTQAMNEALQKARAWPSVKVSTGNQRSWPIYGKTSKLEGWRGRAELNIESKDFKAASELLASLQESLQLQGLNFVVSEETRQNVEKSLTIEAIEAFKKKADTVRLAWGSKGYQLVQMSVGSSGGGPVYRPQMAMMKMGMEAADAAPPQEMAGGESRLSISVNGTIQLQP